MRGYSVFDETMISKAYIHIEENPHIFENLKQPSSLEQAAKVIKSVGKSICGIQGVIIKVGRKPMPKDLVEFDDLVKCVMNVKDNGYDIKGID
jgi:hypothetical protein